MITLEEEGAGTEYSDRGYGRMWIMTSVSLHLRKLTESLYFNIQIISTQASLFHQLLCCFEVTLTLVLCSPNLPDDGDCFSTLTGPSPGGSDSVNLVGPEICLTSSLGDFNNRQVGEC